MIKPKKLRIPYKVGDKLKVELSDNRGTKRGRVIVRTDHLIVVKFKKYKESFNIGQLLGLKVARYTGLKDKKGREIYENPELLEEQI